jgi:hypothetical protein
MKQLISFKICSEKEKSELKKFWTALDFTKLKNHLLQILQIMVFLKIVNEFFYWL